MTVRLIQVFAPGDCDKVHERKGDRDTDETAPSVAVNGDYAPIGDHAAIGNLLTIALVATDGTIDWCCLPELDGSSVFGALLDHRRGGRFRIGVPRGHERARAQRYLPRTNVCETRFDTASGSLSVTDFMPLRGDLVPCDDPITRPEIHRVLGAESGPVTVEVEWSPRFGWGERRTEIRRVPGGFVAELGAESMTLAGLPVEARIVSDDVGSRVEARFTLAPGQSVALVARHGSLDATDRGESRALLEETAAAWRAWVASGSDRSWAGPWGEAVVRSELALKLLTYPKTGSIAAAATTSLPEVLGGVRNWDYRFCWIRDAAFTVDALLSAGHKGEALDYLEFVVRSSMEVAPDPWRLQIMYGLRGERDLSERILSHLEGHRGSRPVRVGNAASKQHQHDIYGELMAAAHQYARYGGTLDGGILAMLAHVADEAAAIWKQPDSGIWEVRDRPRHYVHSKVMVWVALDRAVRLAEKFGLQGRVDVWRRERDAVRAEVLAEGYSTSLGAFVQAYGSTELDAANLLIPVLEFLPADDPRVQGTIDRTLAELTVDGLVRRYTGADGLPGQESAFGFCTFWLVEALALSGRASEAREIFAGILRRANHVGLYAEELDPRTGEHLGNFPQAFTHIGLLRAALRLSSLGAERA